MTEISLSTPLPLNGNTSDVPLSVPAPTIGGPPLLKEETNPDEDFTIKCVCGYKDDDGNTVYCEKCDSWQHIECYYPHEDVPEVHNCTDCLPRFINSAEATERQRQNREEQEREQEIDRKARRSAAGKAKKKRPNGLDSSETPERRTKSPKDTNNTTNNTHHHNNTNNNTNNTNNTQQKRPKTLHKTSASNGRAPSASRSRRSPSKSLQTGVPWSQKPANEQFSQDFIRSFGRPFSDIGNGHNVFTNLSATRDVSSWIQEPRSQGLDSLRNLWNKTSAWYNSLSLPTTLVTEIADNSKEAYGGNPKWHALRLNEPVAHDHIVGELKGHIGRWEDYANESKNKWYRRLHPEPFVFCPSRFPVYVDARHEGSSVRFVRRSCRPSAALRTIVVDGFQAHFFLEAVIDLKQGAELTLPWEFYSSWTKLILSIKSEEVVTAADYDQAQPLVDGLLADYGGCACDKSVPCAFDRFYQRELLQKKHRPKPSKNIEDDEDDRSTSGSVKSKPQSRDLTPMTHVSEVPDMSDRERRKLMARLSLIDQAEAPPKKKKRTSGPHAVCQPLQRKRLTEQKTPDSATDSADGFKFPQVSKKPPPGPPVYPSNYVHCEIQTDPEDGAWYCPPQRPAQREFVPIAVRLLRQCHQRKLQFEEQRKRKASETIEIPAKRQATDPPAETMDTSPDFASPTLSVKSLSVKPSASPILEKTELAISSPVRTETAAIATPVQPLTNGHRGADLRVTLPPTPSFSSFSQPQTPVLTTPGGAQTPYPVTPSLISPSLTGGAVAPSPIKKKLSLSDYAKRRAALPTGSTGPVLNKQSEEQTQQTKANNDDVVMKDNVSVSSPTLSVDMLPPPPLPPSTQAAPST